MSTILNERYMKFELFNGYNYSEGAASEREMTGQKNSKSETLTRSKFFKTQVVFDLSSFQLSRTDKKWFETNRIMRNLSELDMDIDSIKKEALQQELNHYLYKPTYFSYFNKDSITMPDYLWEFKNVRDSINRYRHVPKEQLEQDQAAYTQQAEAKRPTINPIAGAERPAAKRIKSRNLKRSQVALDKPAAGVPPDTLQGKSSADSLFNARIDSVFAMPASRNIVQSATNMARQVKSQVLNSNAAIENYQKEKVVFEIQWHKIIANSVMCIAMFLIGAPLGAIIKRGGLGVPFLISILFFIIYYLLNMQGEKLAKQGLISPMTGIWAADVILLLIGLVFLRQARADARLFDGDAYRVFFDRARQWFVARRAKTAV
jgi:lipopolysaccharide export system permease protein